MHRRIIVYNDGVTRTIDAPVTHLSKVRVRTDREGNEIQRSIGTLCNRMLGQGDINCTTDPKEVTCKFCQKELKRTGHDARNTGSNVTNAGIVHLGKSGPGSAPCCGNRRGHITESLERFGKTPEQSRCKRCDGYYQNRLIRSAERPQLGRVRPPTASGVPRKPAREMTTGELQAELAQETNPGRRRTLELALMERNAYDGVGTPEEVAYGEGWHSVSSSNPYDEPALRAAWEKGRAARKQKQKMNTNYRRGESRGKQFEPSKQRVANDTQQVASGYQGYTLFKMENGKFWLWYGLTDLGKHASKADAVKAIRRHQDQRAKDGVDRMSRDYKSEKGYVAKLVDPTTGNVLARSEPHISNGVGLKTWVREKANELIRRGKRVKAEIVVVFFDPNMA
jgi:hypothetical protein